MIDYYVRKTKREWSVEIRRLAENVLEVHGKAPGIATQVMALINSRNDTLTDNQIVDEFEAILSSGRPWRRIIATVSKKKAPAAAYRERVIREGVAQIKREQAIAKRRR